MSVYVLIIVEVNKEVSNKYMLIIVLLNRNRNNNCRRE